jgi:D-arabinose 1-dehydrogenase-like Zn-dependent alcohol dehydrogenase
MLATGVITPHIDRRFGFQDINEALDCVRSGQAHGRVIVEFESSPVR